jgi:lysophospholipase L1-like esterase
MGGDEPESDSGKNLIVSIGDSVAAGQGNPAPTSPAWISHRCYRSELSGQWIAAERVINADPSPALELRSFACSGATVANGLVGEQDMGPLARPERPQLERLRELAPSRVRAVMISIGANDVGFSRIVIFCAALPNCPDRTDYKPAREWAKENDRPVPTLRKFVAILISGLPEAYADVEEGIPSKIPRRRVLIVEYFDPTRWPATTPCAIFPWKVFRFHIDDLVTRDESRWAHDDVLAPLNQAIADAAKQHKWKLVDGVDERFDGHGICAPPSERWVRTLDESVAMQHDHLGTLHPNEAGHRATAELIVPQLTRALRRHGKR